MKHPAQFLILTIALYFVWQVVRPGNFKIENMTVNGGTRKGMGGLIAKTSGPEAVATPTVDRLLNIYRVFPGVDFEIVLAAFKWGKAYDIDPELLLAIAFTESSFRLQVVNAGCYGLMGISVATWKSRLQLNVSRIFEADYNVQQGARILRHYIDLAGDTWRGVHFFNNGPSGKYNNLQYVLKVRNFYNRLSAGGGNNV